MRPVPETAQVAETAQGSQDVTVVLPRALAALAGDRLRVTVPLREPSVLAEVLDLLAAAYPVLGRRVRDETGALRRYVNVYVDGADVRADGGPAVRVRPGQEIRIIASVAGG